ncbi:MAG TPA: transglycosylase domain-containing protein [Pseudolabrys sp.]|nr:transglycosylase domain-containing protein [Pseudolabrys sp.]
MGYSRRVQASGKISGSTATWQVPRSARLIIVAFAALLLLPYLLTPVYAVLNPISTVMIWRKLTGQRVEHRFIPISRIAPSVPLAVIIAEDGRFCSHHGVDLAEIREAITEANDFDDMRGGSTITQQLAKNLFLWPGRSIVRKALEFPLALWIDLVLSKRRILELYLNVAEWGPNGEFGVEAGAWRAFGKSAHDVSAYESALMAAMLPNPIERNARRPGAGVRRLAGLYAGRAARAPRAASCLRQRH